MIVPAAIEQWRALAEKYRGTILLPEEILSIIWSESSGNPAAVNPSDPSYGLMQCTIPIGEKFAGITSSDDLLDPDTNIKAGAGFLAYLKAKYAQNYPITDPNCAWVAAYNEGEPNLWKKRPDPNYISAFIAHMDAFGVMPQ